MQRNITSTVSNGVPPSSKGSESSLLLFRDIIQTCAECTASSTVPNSQVESSSSNPSSLSMPSQTLYKLFFQQLKHCDDATISCDIVDLISIISMHTECPREEDFTFKAALESVYTSYLNPSANKTNLPYTFFKLCDILTKSTTNDDESEITSFIQESFASLVQFSNGLFKTKDAYTSAFVHKILAHWSALILHNESQYCCLNEIAEALGSFISVTMRRSRRKALHHTRKANAFPGLNEKNFVSVFELALHLLNASFSLAKPHRTKTKHTSKGYQANGPYSDILQLLEVESKLLTIFQYNDVFFPQRCVYIVIKNSMIMARLCDKKLQLCTQWRNSRHSQIGSLRDFASVDFLQPLLNGVASNCVGAIISFCDTMRARHNNDGGSWSSIYRLSKATASLLHRCKGVKDTLQSICQSQSLTFPNCLPVNESVSPMSKKINRRHISPGRKRQRISSGGSPRRGIRSPASSVLESLPVKSNHGEGLQFDSITDGYEESLQSDSEELTHSAGEEDDLIVDGNDSLLGSGDNDSFCVVGTWAT